MTPKRCILETDRLLLRELTLGDVDSALEIFSDPIAMAYSRLKNREEVKERVQLNLNSYAENGFGLWACLLKNTGQFLGMCGIIYHEDIDGVCEREISYHFLREFWGQGFAAEAARASKNYAFQNCDLSRLISIIDPDHHASRRVAERVGMSMEKEVKWLARNFNVYCFE
jgi:[ribosomal protein S5]-alanine N-acetyltransferase